MTSPDESLPPEGEEVVTVTETRTVRYLTHRGEGTHPLEADLSPVDLSGSESEPSPEADRPQTTGMVGDYTYNPIFDEVMHEMPVDDLPDKVYPRHDRYAAENTGDAPERVIPGGITNAHPDFTVGEAIVTADGPAPTAPAGNTLKDGTVVETPPPPPAPGNTEPEPEPTDGGSAPATDGQPSAAADASTSPEPGPADIPPPPETPPAADLAAPAEG